MFWLFHGPAGPAGAYPDDTTCGFGLWILLALLLVAAAVSVIVLYHRRSGSLARELKTKGDLIRETGGRYERLFENAAIGIFEAGKDGEVNAANRSLAVLLGYSGPKELTGNKDVLQDFLKYASGAGGTSVNQKGIRLLNSLGKPVYVNLSIRTIVDESGAAKGYEGFVEDVTGTQAARKAALDSDKRYSELFRLSPAGIYLSTEDGTIVEANRTFAAIFGYESGETVRSINASALYADPSERRKFIDELKTNGQVRRNLLVGRKADGSTIYVYENAELGYDPNYRREVIHGALMDVTELIALQKEVELHNITSEASREILTAALRGGELKEIIEASLAAIVARLDVAGAVLVQKAPQGAKCAFESWREGRSTSGEFNLSLEKTEALFADGSRFRVCEGDEISRAFEMRSCAVARISVEGQEWGYLVFLCNRANRVWRATETDFLVTAGDMFSGVIRRQLERKVRLDLEKERDDLLAAFERLSEGVVVSDAGGIIRYVNSTFTKLTGFTNEDVVGKSTEILRSTEHEPEFFDKLWNTLRAGNVFRARFKSIRKDGSIIFLDKTIGPVIDSRGDITGYVEISSDVTSRISLEEQLVQSQKMEAVGLLAGGIAHDFNNILGAILGYASFMKSKMPEGHEFRKYVETIEANAARAAELTSQLLAFARGGKYKVVPLSVNDIVRKTVRELGPTSPRRVSLDAGLSDDLPAVNGDPRQMEQVIMNLCANALEAMPSGGRLKISASAVELSRDDCAGNVDARPGRYVRIDVTDTGVGMEKTTAGRVFEPFFTTKEKGKGMGLSMVYGIVRNHGGFVDVESALGKGTTFRIYYPAAEGDAATTAGLSSGGRRRTILVVEDEPLMRELLVDSLEGGGYKVLSAADGEAAVKAYTEGGREIGLVIMDMMMPGINGAEAFRRLKAIDRDVKVLLASGYNLSVDSEELLSEGVIAFLDKPFQVSEILEKVSSVLGGSGES